MNILKEKIDLTDRSDEFMEFMDLIKNIKTHLFFSTEAINERNAYILDHPEVLDDLQHILTTLVLEHGYDSVMDYFNAINKSLDFVLPELLLTKSYVNVAAPAQNVNNFHTFLLALAMFN